MMILKCEIIVITPPFYGEKETLGLVCIKTKSLSSFLDLFWTDIKQFLVLLFSYFSLIFILSLRVYTKLVSQNSDRVMQIRRFFAVVSWDSLRHRTVALWDVIWVKERDNISLLQLNHHFLNLWYNLSNLFFTIFSFP